jgi:hypothetical protein
MFLATPKKLACLQKYLNNKPYYKMIELLVGYNSTIDELNKKK